MQAANRGKTNRSLPVITVTVGSDIYLTIVTTCHIYQKRRYIAYVM